MNFPNKDLWRVIFRKYPISQLTCSDWVLSNEIKKIVVLKSVTYSGCVIFDLASDEKKLSCFLMTLLSTAKSETNFIFKAGLICPERQ